MSQAVSNHLYTKLSDEAFLRCNLHTGAPGSPKSLAGGSRAPLLTQNAQRMLHSRTRSQKQKVCRSAQA